MDGCSIIPKGEVYESHIFTKKDEWFKSDVFMHEWLWRNNLEEENQRKADVETIYTSTDKNKIQELIKKYHVVYLFIGTCEYEKYGKINTDLLDSLGQVVFRKGKTLIIKV